MNDVKAPIWDANLYLKFADARLRPALDLMGRLDPANGARAGHAIYDLGCGAGNISRILAERFPEAPIVGVDSSEEMLAKARTQTVDKRVTFTAGDLTHFKPGLPPSILYSNAAYQWVENHIDYFPGLLKLLPSGGQLAIQMPRNHEAPSHALMRQAAQAGPWRDKLAKVGGIRSVFEPGRYYDALKPLVLRSRCLGNDLPAGADRQGSGGAIHRGQRPAALHGGAERSRANRLLRHLCQAFSRGLSDARRTASRCFPSAACSSWRVAHEAAPAPGRRAAAAGRRQDPGMPCGAAGDGGRGSSSGGRCRAGGVAPRRLGGRCRDRRADGAGRRRAAIFGPGRRRLPVALQWRNRRHDGL